MDFYDKLIFCVTLIAIVIILAFNTFCCAATYVSSTELDNHTVQQIDNNYVIKELDSGGSVGFYYNLEPGVRYKVSFEGQPQFRLSFTDETPADNVVCSSYLRSFSSGYEFVASAEKMYVFSYIIGSNSAPFDSFKVEQVSGFGFSDAVGSLATTISSDSLLSVFGNTISYILVVVIVSLGFYLILKMIRNLVKGKAKI